ncbi:DinB family protein [Paenarthrobacter sp. NPDC089989]|uniref:DinB family protein n=1 Tax=unclassified Paenarthrobacter TaxID=2634190 RepID=UPI003820F38D
MDEKATLLNYLRTRRADLLGKVEGLSEYDARRPMTPTGTNLLGLVKHVASVELGYFGETFGRPDGRELPWYEATAEPDADMWVPADESMKSIIELHHYSAKHSDATIEELPLDAPGVVPWWSEEKKNVTLHQILVHMCVETARHAGHADIIRELIDGQAGQRPNDPNIPPRNSEELAAHRYRIEEAALQANRRR